MCVNSKVVAAAAAVVAAAAAAVALLLLRDRFITLAKHEHIAINLLQINRHDHAQRMTHGR